MQQATGTNGTNSDGTGTDKTESKDGHQPAVNRLQWGGGPLQFGLGTMLVTFSFMAVLFGLYAALMRASSKPDEPLWSLWIIALTIALPMAVMIGLSFGTAVRRIVRSTRTGRPPER